MTSKNDLSIPADVFTKHIFPFLGVRSLTKCVLVCKEWRLAVDDDLIWKARCAFLWGKEGRINVPRVIQNVPESLYPFTIFSPSLSLSVKEIKTILSQRGMHSYSHFMYKSEFLECLANTQPKEFPKWQLSTISKWKASYLSSILRVEYFPGISKPELVNSKWEMVFNFNQQQMSEIKFHGNGSFEMNLIHDTLRDLTWHFPPVKGNCEPFCYGQVQVGSYPPLVVSRNEDWGFCLTNDHVQIKQVAV